MTHIFFFFNKGLEIPHHRLQETTKSASNSLVVEVGISDVGVTVGVGEFLEFGNSRDFKVKSQREFLLHGVGVRVGRILGIVFKPEDIPVKEKMVGWTPQEVVGLGRPMEAFFLINWWMDLHTGNFEIPVTARRREVLVGHDEVFQSAWCTWISTLWCSKLVFVKHSSDHKAMHCMGIRDVYTSRCFMGNDGRLEEFSVPDLGIIGGEGVGGSLIRT